MKNEVLLLTLHSQNNNFGSVLQGLALYKALEKLGADVSILDYRPFYSNGATNKKAFVRNFIVNGFFFVQYVIRTSRFSNINKMEKMTSRYKNYDDLCKINFKYNLYLIGSDQVWNDDYLCGQDPAYYLDFIKSGIKASYAASVGRIADEKSLLALSKKIGDFNFVSMREEKSVQQIEKYGINAEYVLDPVFLQPLSFYHELEHKSKEKDYILAYIIEKDDFIAEVVEKVSKITKKKVIQIGGFAAKCRYDKFPRSAGPREFLGLIDGADLIITSSFHGTAFAHIYEKQFIVVMPSSNTLRLENILHTAGTEDRVVSNIDDVSVVLNKKIEYESVSKRIELKRKKSQEYLKKILTDKEGITI